MGWKTKLNPNESDFMKLRNGSLVVDVFAGELGFARFFARMFLKTPLFKQSQSDPNGYDYTAFMKDMEGYSGRHEFSQTRPEKELWNFLVMRTNPGWTLAPELIFGTTPSGYPVKWYQSIAGRIFPIFTQDAYQATIDDDLLVGGSVGAVSFTGLANIQTYPSSFGRSVREGTPEEFRKVLKKRIEQKLKDFGGDKGKVRSSIKGLITESAPYSKSKVIVEDDEGTRVTNSVKAWASVGVETKDIPEAQKQMRQWLIKSRAAENALKQELVNYKESE
jgi:hypothetical protein